jgi:tRNA nucleotidyltransferase/poly(A) polymerase
MPSRQLISHPPDFPNILQTIHPVLPKSTDVWLVGGAVRDGYLGRQSRDLDLVVDGPARQAARAVANALGADYYDLDRERDTGRVLLAPDDGERVTLDFSHLAPGGIEADLSQRDFTVNAMAVHLESAGVLIDPTGGLDDLEHRRLRACGSQAIIDDPVRALRAVRLAHQLRMEVAPGTIDQLRKIAGKLDRVSAERLRDELFRILLLPKAVGAVRQAIELGFLFDVLPELAPLDGLAQPAPHRFDGLEHSLRVADCLAEWLWAGEGSEVFWQSLEPYSGRVREHLHEPLNQDRVRGQLLVLAGLLHDVGKPMVVEVSDDGIPRFHGHEAAGADIVVRRAEGLHLSRAEADSLGRIVANHMRPGQIAHQESVTKRAIYRFFRTTRQDGVDICILALADKCGQTDGVPAEARWQSRIDVVKRLLQAYFDRRDSEVSPPPLMNGDELMAELNLGEGPLIGEMLEAIQQAQVEGLVRTKEDALAFAAQWQFRA